MSGSVSGKFQDHYLILGVDPKADSEALQAAYGKLAQKFRPGNPETADPEKFEAVNMAYEVLSDPALRIAFDKIKGIDHDAGPPKFTGADFFNALEQGTVLRATVLSILYDRRRINSFKPSLSVRHLEGMMHVKAEELNFALWYLKQRGLVVSDDKSNLEISVAGMDFLEQNRPPVEGVMRLVRESALAQPRRRAADVDELKLGVLSRAVEQSAVSEEITR